MIAILAGIHLLAPRPSVTTTTLSLSFLGGELMAGYLGFGILTVPIGQDPAEISAFERFAVTIGGVDALAILPLVFKIPPIQRRIDGDD